MLFLSGPVDLSFFQAAQLVFLSFMQLASSPLLGGWTGLRLFLVFLVLPLLLSKEYVYLRVNIIILYGLHSRRQRPSGSHQFQGLPETNLLTSCFSELLFWMECFSLEDWYKPVKCKFSL